MTLWTSPIIGLIPARGGSKGVPGKNMRKIAEKPLIEFSILAAQQSNYIDTVYVSSDDPAILRHAQTMGATGIVRPDRFATDTASAVEVVEHFIGTLPKTLAKEDPYIVYLQPTSPFRTARHIDDALEQMRFACAQSLISVSETEKSPFKMFTLDAKGYLQSLFDERLSNARRQDLTAVFAPNGAIYVFRVSEFKARGGFPSNGSMPFVMNANDSLDIDTEDDIRRAELILGVK
jgi:CMP-N,N'-diacetyllegionaminic acid synthase